MNNTKNYFEHIDGVNFPQKKHRTPNSYNRQELREKHDQDDIRVWLLGPLDLQNNLLHNFISQETGAHISTTSSHRVMRKLIQTRLSSTIFMLDNQIEILDEILENLLSMSGKLDSKIKTIIFNADRDTCIKRWVQYQVVGIFYKDDQPSLIAKGIKKIHEGEYWYSKESLQRLLFEASEQDQISSCDKNKLTSREQNILDLVALGKGNDEIAELMCISSHTVKTHLSNVYRKLGVANRVQATLWSINKQEKGVDAAMN